MPTAPALNCYERAHYVYVATNIMPCLQHSCAVETGNGYFVYSVADSVRDVQRYKQGAAPIALQTRCRVHAVSGNVVRLW
eukprot:1282013-Pyramimonas_sp.AAC.1